MSDKKLKIGMLLNCCNCLNTMSAAAAAAPVAIAPVGVPDCDVIPKITEKLQNAERKRQDDECQRVMTTRNRLLGLLAAKLYQAYENPETWVEKEEKKSSDIHFRVNLAEWDLEPYQGSEKDLRLIWEQNPRIWRKSNTTKVCEHLLTKSPNEKTLLTLFKEKFGYELSLELLAGKVVISVYF